MMIKLVQTTKVTPVTVTTSERLADAVLDEQVRAQVLLRCILFVALATAKLKHQQNLLA